MNGSSPEFASPGEALREMLRSKGWTQGDLALILGRPVQAVNEIIQGKKSVTPEMAVALGVAFANGPETWMNLESAYRLSQAKRDNSDHVARRARLFELAPVQEMERRG